MARRRGDTERKNTVSAYRGKGLFEARSLRFPVLVIARSDEMIESDVAIPVPVEAAILTGMKGIKRIKNGFNVQGSTFTVYVNKIV